MLLKEGRVLENKERDDIAKVILDSKNYFFEITERDISLHTTKIEGNLYEYAIKKGSVTKTNGFKDIRTIINIFQGIIIQSEDKNEIVCNKK